ncbi:MAG TPA: hypothetical protein VHW60_07885 [Caulobacteraceae bacterium]|jgi:hypothetical protein|nr:hypothetical protein [Caulobacteraceae bacterium]
MRQALLVAAVLGAMSLAPVAAHADDPSDTDVRCLVVGAALTGSSDPSVQSLGRASLLYFAGRLDGRGDGQNLPSRVAAVDAKMTGDDLKAQIPKCSALFTAVTQSLQAIGDAMRAQNPPPPAPTH